jgi:glyoxylase-like metal-dependent hydrolase (beta-lactamase superfamily II)
MRELQTGIWHWQAPHPEWEGPEVSSYAIDDGERLLLFDPIATPSLVDELAAGRVPVVVLTSTWHERDARDVVQRLGAHVYVPPPETGTADPIHGEVFAPGDRLAVGVDAYPGREDPHDLMLWVESRRALVSGDTLVDVGDGLELRDDWLPAGATREQTLTMLRPLLELPVELVLATHGGPFDRAALERALA